MDGAVDERSLFGVTLRRVELYWGECRAFGADGAYAPFIFTHPSLLAQDRGGRKGLFFCFALACSVRQLADANAFSLTPSYSGAG